MRVPSQHRRRRCGKRERCFVAVSRPWFSTTHDGTGEPASCPHGFLIGFNSQELPIIWRHYPTGDAAILFSKAVPTSYQTAGIRTHLARYELSGSYVPLSTGQSLCPSSEARFGRRRKIGSKSEESFHAGNDLIY